MQAEDTLRQELNQPGGIPIQGLIETLKHKLELAGQLRENALQNLTQIGHMEDSMIKSTLNLLKHQQILPSFTNHGVSQNP